MGTATFSKFHTQRKTVDCILPQVSPDLHRLSNTSVVENYTQDVKITTGRR